MVYIFFLSKRILFMMGILAIIISNSSFIDFFLEGLTDDFLYMITGAVLIGSFLFRFANKYIKRITESILTRVPLRLFTFLMIVIIGLISSIIKAALFLVEIIAMLLISKNHNYMYFYSSRIHINANW